MQKARVFDFAQTSWVLMFLMFGSSGLAGAQSPSLSDVVETAKQAKLQEYSKSISDSYKGAPAFDATPPKGSVAKPSDVSVPIAPQSLPLLRAIYGVNDILEAELLLDGQSFSIYSDDERFEIGPWTHGRVFHDGVLLLRAPLSDTQRRLIDGLAVKGFGRTMSCSKLGLKRAKCLVLTTNKASSGVVATVPSVGARGSSTSNPPLPPLPLPR